MKELCQQYNHSIALHYGPLYRCPRCATMHNIPEWDAATEEYFNTNTPIVSMYDDIYTRGRLLHLYICPTCGARSPSRIIVEKGKLPAFRTY